MQGVDDPGRGRPVIGSGCPDNHGVGAGGSSSLNPALDRQVRAQISDAEAPSSQHGRKGKSGDLMSGAGNEARHHMASTAGVSSGVESHRQPAHDASADEVFLGGIEVS